jgi:hypothetical protein
MPISAYAKGKADGVADVRAAWLAWFKDLPAELQEAIRLTDSQRRQREAFALATSGTYRVRPTDPIHW